MRYYGTPHVLFREVPSEVSLAFQITGCRKMCSGCHSTFLWKEQGTLLTEAHLQDLLDKYDGMLSCVLFFGGEWHESALITLLKLCEANGLKTCLYTGEDDVSCEIKSHLTYLKVGEYIESRGGLDSENTNQKFLRLSDESDMTKRFRKTINVTTDT